MTDKLVAEWRTRGGKHWYRLYRSIINDYHYAGESSLGSATADGVPQFDEDAALAYMEHKVSRARACGQSSFKRVN